ncbi:hypothetical protein TNCV_174961 [Trichonephila clavipes]|nr:hypothetical protein TNCV_174961 [Trichonephila clavipes]
MTEQNLIEHIVNRLEPQVLDYVDVRSPTTTSPLLQVVSKFEERGSFPHKKTPRIPAVKGQDNIALSDKDKDKAEVLADLLENQFKLNDIVSPE